MTGLWLPKEHILVETSTVSLPFVGPSIDLAARPERPVGQVNLGKGLVIAISIIGLWALSLSVLLTLPITYLPLWFKLVAMLGQTFLCTGLFITGHDAMHGSICPDRPKLNHRIGKIAVLCYGLFSYQNLLRKHWLHHRHPASEHDPDFHESDHQNPFYWYVHFMVQYWSWGRFLGLILLFNSAYYLLHVSYSNIILFWAIPSILSSVQLFFFGTFLPHRRPEGGYFHPHRAQTTALPIFWSFLTCYHFGYHQEHHEYPHVPWWQLPAVYKSSC
jgi:beta-carotene/zeaxanthin 4-ketolase